MKEKKRKKSARPIFDSLRKPTAPPTRKIGNTKPDEKIYPSRRKSKHQKEKNLDE